MPWHWSHTSVTALLLGLLSSAAFVSAQTIPQQSLFEDGFDSALPSWRIESGQRQLAVIAHARSAQVVHAGGGSELVRFSTDNVESVRLVHEIPPALVFEEFESSVWVKSNQRSLALAARLRFPHAVDPRTNRTLTVDVIGDRYSTPQQWQRLTCATTDTAIGEALIRLRNQLGQMRSRVNLDTREAYVAELVVIVESLPGQTEVYLDELAAGPIVTPKTLSAEVETEHNRSDPETPRVLIGDDHFRLAGDSPFILRFTPHHGESATTLAECRVNAAWIPDYEDSGILFELDQAGLSAIAELPVPPDIGDHTDAGRLEVGLIPISDHPRILFWSIGARLEGEDLPQVSAWTEMVRRSDYEFSRPLLGNVASREREFHRRLDCVGASRHILQTSVSPRTYLEFLSRKRDLGFPDKPMFTYIQTEPDPGLRSRWPSGRSEPVIEPEQIWLQCYAALSAGYKGIGYWKHTPLNQDGIGSDERLMAITLMNRQIELLEPWLATGKVTEVVPATFTDPATEASAGSGWGRRFLGGGRRTGHDAELASPVRVAVLESDAGYVLLPVWYEQDAQFQPGPMVAEELFFKIAPKGDDVQQAWLVTTTDVSASPVELKRVDAGHQIRLSGFDQHAAIIIAKNTAMIEELQRRIAATQESSAQIWINLAAAKLRRVESVQQEFVDLDVSIENGSSLLDGARRLLQDAESEFAAGRLADSRRNSERAMMVLRMFQRAHWDRAVSGLSSGVSAPYTICFQTLPEHWRMLGNIGRMIQGENLLKSGEFEDRDTMFASGWEPYPIEDSSIVTESQLRRRNAQQGTYALHLSARRLSPPASAGELDQPAIRWISPPVSVYAGQIVHVGGQVRLENPLVEHTDGLFIYETTHGSLGGIRWRKPGANPGWEPFQLIREIRESGELRVVIELRGLGDVSIDDIQVIAFDP